MELFDKNISGICPNNNCKKVTITDLLQVYNDLAGEGLEGKYTDVTRDKIWRNEYLHKYAVASGIVKDVSKEIFGERIYIHVQLSTSHYVDIYVKSSERSKLEKIEKDEAIQFTGRLTELGSGIMFSHEIDNAEIISDL